MHKAVKIILICAVFTAGCYLKRVETNADQRLAEVAGINDGDTITVVFKHNNLQRKIRLATIDAPEFNQPYGRKSRQNLSALAYRKNAIIVSKSEDRYGRIIGEVLVDGKNINVEQIKSGFAWHYKYHEKQQTRAERMIYSQAENEAKRKKLGLWQDKNPIPPWDYRKEEKDRKLIKLD